MPSIADIHIRSQNEPVNFVFSYEWPCGNASTSNSVNWTLCVIQSQVFFNVPAALSVERSKEAFVTLLEIAEEEMDCNQIIISFGKDRPEKRKYLSTLLPFFQLPSEPLHLARCTFILFSFLSPLFLLSIYLVNFPHSFINSQKASYECSCFWDSSYYRLAILLFLWTQMKIRNLWLMICHKQHSVTQVSHVYHDNDDITNIHKQKHHRYNTTSSSSSFSSP